MLKNKAYLKIPRMNKESSNDVTGFTYVFPNSMDTRSIFRIFKKEKVVIDFSHVEIYPNHMEHDEIRKKFPEIPVDFELETIIIVDL